MASEHHLDKDSQSRYKYTLAYEISRVRLNPFRATQAEQLGTYRSRKLRKMIRTMHDIYDVNRCGGSSYMQRRIPCDYGPGKRYYEKYDVICKTCGIEGTVRLHFEANGREEEQNRDYERTLK